jgi:hypothetical protein
VDGPVATLTMDVAEQGGLVPPIPITYCISLTFVI